MPKINQGEYEVLKGLGDKWKWIARNYNGALIIYTSKPMENPNLYWDGFGERMDDRLFQFIQWEDKEPYNIQELIEEYLYDNQPKLFIDGQEQSFEFIEESEEKEVKKDIEWLKEETSAVLREVFNNHALDYVKYIEVKRQLERLFNQLDEPETLSEDWIQEHSYNVHLLGTPDVTTVAVPRDDLQNLLVPKQEIIEEQAWEIIHGKYGDEVLQNNIDYVESQGYVVIEKPTVPQFVADWHVQNKYYLLGAKFERIADWEDKRVVDWYRQCSGRHNNNLANAQETIALMDLVGYEVEEEQKYVIDTDDVEISDGNHYLTHLSLSKDDTELPIVGYKDDAIRFYNKEQAQAIVDYVGGRVEELEE